MSGWFGLPKRKTCPLCQGRGLTIGRRVEPSKQIVSVDGKEIGETVERVTISIEKRCEICNGYGRVLDI